MTTLQIALVLVVVVMLIAWLGLRRRAGDSKPAAPTDRIDTVTGWPPTVTRVLSTRERVAFGTLVRALPEYMVLAQVPMARFLNVPKRNSYADWLRRVGYQCVDFLVCDMNAQVVAVVELQSPQMTERARKRMTRMARALKAADIPMHVWREEALPSADAAREVLLPRPAATAMPPTVAGSAAAALTMTAATTAAAVPAGKKNPFDDSARDSTQDEMIELLEPPPSTWFDDIDSGEVPLDKR